MILAFHDDGMTKHLRIWLPRKHQGANSRRCTCEKLSSCAGKKRKHFIGIKWGAKSKTTMLKPQQPLQKSIPRLGGAIIDSLLYYAVFFIFRIIAAYSICFGSLTRAPGARARIVFQCFGSLTREPGARVRLVFNVLGSFQNHRT